MGDRLIHPPEDKPWGMFEFAVSDPDPRWSSQCAPGGFVTRLLLAANREMW